VCLTRLEWDFVAFCSNRRSILYKDVLCGRCMVFVVTFLYIVNFKAVVALVLCSDEDGSESSGGEESKDNAVSRFCTVVDRVLVDQMHNAYITV